MSRQFTLASQVAQHVLKRDGPLTTHRLYRACLAEDAPSASTYKQPGHREWRLFGDTIVRGTTGPPNPDHLVRSVKFLKKTMRELNAYGKVGHTTIDSWLAACQRANVAELAKEAQAAQAIAEDEKDSPSVWIDAERYSRVLGEQALTPKPLPKGQPKRGTINPKFIKPREELEEDQRRY